VWLHKVSIPTLRRVIGNFRGGRALKTRVCKGKYEPKLEFAEGF